MSEFERPVCLPVLALRGLCVFPKMLTHFDVGRKSSMAAVEEALREDQQIFLVTQKDVETDHPKRNDLYTVGTVSIVKQVLRLPGENMRILVEGQYRAELLDIVQSEPYLFGRMQKLEELPYNHSLPRVEALLRQAHSQFEQFAELSGRNMQEALLRLLTSEDAGYTADFIGQDATFSYQNKQQLLEQLHPVKRLEQTVSLMAKELDILRLENEISDRVQENVDKNQRDYYLREQMKVIDDELGGGDDPDDYAEKINKAHLPDEVREKLLKENERLSRTPFGSAEATVLRSYLDTCLEIPWNTRTRDRVNVAAAKKILDADHEWLDKVKTRILEFLAVKQLNPDLKNQIICLVGPPGTGKTSIAASVAHAMNRKYVRVSLGGVRDEADIRGHRKTYVAAMPGRIIDALIKAKVKNPLILLDEVDKLTSDAHGDPASALLEVLDPEQNKTFRDHFVELPFDLSECLFITTANTLETVPRPLIDRMEVIELSSYTRREKLAIAKDHLIPKQIKRHGLTRRTLRLTDEAIYEVIDCYTREAGVRNLERTIAELCRKAAKKIVDSDGKLKSVTIDKGDVASYLGARKIMPEKIDDEDLVGVVNGLAYTEDGGDMLKVEAAVLDGTGKLELTGKLGDVMKESAETALSYVRQVAREYGIPTDFYKTKDIHIHVPEGAVPKDGPSAGVTMVTALVSALAHIPVAHDVAMTGEVTLTGRVLPIGGLREKTMAAYAAGVGTVLIPKANTGDLDEIDPEARAALRFIPISNVREVLDNALRRNAVPITVNDTAKKSTGETLVVIPPLCERPVQGVTADGAQSQ